MTQATETMERSRLNLPNQITIARLVVSLFVFVLIPLGYYGMALIAFILAALTDWTDGYIARRYNLVTRLGRILDPFADKILICGTFIFLAAAPGSQIDAWMAVVVVGRELLVTALRGEIEQRGGDFSAKTAGKWKMVFQCLAVVLSLWLLYVGRPSSESFAGDVGYLPAMTRAVAWLAIVSTVYSGAGYIVAAVRILTDDGPEI